MAGNRQLETGITNKILKYLNSLEGCKARKRFAGPGKKGEPDITGAYRGLRLEIEVKAGDNQPSKIQIARLKAWKDCGCLSMCVWSLEEVQVAMIKLSDEFWWNSQKKAA
ncbi:MAG: hypothetical protein JEZ11_03890 [Desulfobacterales bacterium]|nr:hypothetical protein [Desulfobacterales bacterium]